MVLFEAVRTDVKVVHKEDDRQRLMQLDVALQTMATGRVVEAPGQRL